MNERRGRGHGDETVLGLSPYEVVWATEPLTPERRIERVGEGPSRFVIRP